MKDRPEKDNGWRPKAGDVIMLWWDPGSPPGFRDIRKCGNGSLWVVQEADYPSDGVVYLDGQYIRISSTPGAFGTSRPRWKHVFPGGPLKEAPEQEVARCSCSIDDLFHGQGCTCGAIVRYKVPR